MVQYGKKLSRGSTMEIQTVNHENDVYKDLMNDDGSSCWPRTPRQQRRKTLESSGTKGTEPHTSRI